jgi:DNA-binding MarR family transcriptional regulator
VNADDERVIGLMGAAWQALRQALSARLAAHRLTPRELWALTALREQPGLSPGELGPRLRLDAPATSRLVADLRRRKLVEVRPDRQDRRRTRLVLGERGTALAERLATIDRECEELALRGLSAAEAAALREGLRRVARNLSGPLAPPAPPGAAPTHRRRS